MLLLPIPYSLLSAWLRHCSPPQPCRTDGFVCLHPPAAAQRLLEADFFLNDKVCRVWQPHEGVVFPLLQYENDIAWLQAWFCAACFTPQHHLLAILHAGLNWHFKCLLFTDQAVAITARTPIACTNAQGCITHPIINTLTGTSTQQALQHGRKLDDGSATLSIKMQSVTNHFKKPPIEN